MLGLLSTTTIGLLVAPTLAAGITRRDLLCRAAAAGGVAALWPLGCAGPEDSSVAADGGPDYGATYFPPDGRIPNSFGLEPGYATIPCRFPADLDHYLEGLLGVCSPDLGGSNGVGQVFFLDPSGARPLSPVTQVDFGALGDWTLGNLALLPGGAAVVTADGPEASGFYWFSLSGVGEPMFIPFLAGHRYGGGPLVLGGKLFIPTANFDPANFTYQPGTLLVYDLNADGSVDAQSVRSRATSGLNPTGTVQLDDTRILVLNSGDFSETAEARLDIFDIATELAPTTMGLGALTAQLGGELALTPDGRVVIGNGDGSGRVLIADLAAGTVTTVETDDDSFHVSVVVDGAVAYVTGFGGLLTVINLATVTAYHNLQVDPEAAGPAAMLGGNLVQTVPFGAVRISPQVV